MRADPEDRRSHGGLGLESGPAPAGSDRKSRRGKRGRGGARTGWGAHHQGGTLRSPLARRILAVNLLAPILLAGGFLYLDTYEAALTTSTFQALRTEGDLIAAAIGEGAVNLEVSVEGPVVRATHGINPDTARQMVRRLATLADVRARLFDASGRLIADSRRLVGYGGMVQVLDLPPPVRDDGIVMNTLRRLYDMLARPWGEEETLPQYVEKPIQTAGDYPEVARALSDSEAGQAMRRRHIRSRVLSVAVPVQYYKQVVGAIMVSRGAEEIEETLFEMRVGVLEIFLGTLALTIMLSLYLAGTIARPLLRLARAADNVRRGQGGRQPIPDLTNRRDELGDLSDALIAMTEALWMRMDAIERFAADVAHEIKNPLTSLRSAVETVARIDDPHQQKRLMAVIVDDVQRLDRLITDISDASRLDAELSRSEAQPVAIRPMLEMLAEVHAAAAEKQGNVSIIVEADSSDPMQVQGVEGRLVQVFRNLIGNAVSFSPPDSTIRLHIRRQKGQVIATVDDEGPGIPPGKEKDIFKRFYSERPQGEKYGTHSGLGLSISKQIVETFGGTVTAENRRPEGAKVAGARFTVTLPAG